METQIDNLGKVRITVDDNPWNINKDYDRLVFVKVEETGGIYMSKRPVPASTSIHNRYYWLKFGKEASVNPDRIGEEVTGEYAQNMQAPHNYGKGKIFYINNHGEEETGIISYYIALINGNINDNLLDNSKFATTNIAAEALNIKINNLHEVSRSGNYNDLSNKPTNLSSFVNDTKFISVNQQTYTAQEKQVGRSNIDAIGTQDLNNALGVFINYGAYDNVNKKIILYNKKGTSLTSIAEIDAKDFIKDGMVDTVFISNNKLIIRFNTDSGKQDIEINLSSIFNPNNYYTKTEIDTELNKKVDASTLHTVATSGSYNDLKNKPLIPAAQVNADWNAQSGVAKILNKPTTVSSFSNDVGYIVSKTINTDIGTTPSINVIGNTITVFSNPLTSLTINQVSNNYKESVLIFTAGANMTFTYPNNIKFVNDTPSFEQGVEYIMSIWNNYIIVGEIV